MLLGTPASPLRKALIDSGLGEDLAGSGMETELKETIFSAGLKGVAAADEEKAAELVTETLRRLAREGLDGETVRASLNTCEFRLRENNTGSYPRGLILMLRSLTTWLYDGDPFEPLSFEAPLAAVRDRALKGGWLEGLIERCLLDNPHRTTLFLRPDAGQAGARGGGGEGAAGGGSGRDGRGRRGAPAPRGAGPEGPPGGARRSRRPGEAAAACS